VLCAARVNADHRVSVNARSAWRLVRRLRHRAVRGIGGRGRRRLLARLQSVGADIVGCRELESPGATCRVLVRPPRRLDLSSGNPDRGTGLVLDVRLRAEQASCPRRSAVRTGAQPLLPPSRGRRHRRTSMALRRRVRRFFCDNPAVGHGPSPNLDQGRRAARAAPRGRRNRAGAACGNDTHLPAEEALRCINRSRRWPRRGRGKPVGLWWSGKHSP